MVQARAEEDAREHLPGLEPERRLTDWGRSERLTALADATAGRFLYDYWFRVSVEGLEHVPTRGGALLVANRAGRLPLDAAMIAHAIREEHPARRRLQLATNRSYAGIPGLGMVLTKLGAVRAHPANLHRLLYDEDELVLSFPEDGGAGRKPLGWRYRLRPFDHPGALASALRAGVPIVPVAVLGAEEALPSVGSVGVLAGRGPRLSLEATLPLPAKFKLRFLPQLGPDEPGQEPDPAQVGELGEAIRSLIQANLVEMVGQRRSVWLG